jgi:hypothetical protein
VNLIPVQIPIDRQLSSCTGGKDALTLGLWYGDKVFAFFRVPRDLRSLINAFNGLQNDAMRCFDLQISRY